MIRLILRRSSTLVVLLGILLVSKELGAHTLGGNVLSALLLLNTVGVSLVGIIVGTSILLL